MKDLQDWAVVKKLKKQNMNISEISKALGMSRTTVYKLLSLDEEPVYRRTNYPCKVKYYEEQIIEWRINPEFDFNGTRIFREIKKRGYQGGISPVYLFLKRLNENASVISKKATVRFETPVGDQAQFDWTEYEMWIGERKRTVYCFSMILAAVQ